MKVEVVVGVDNKGIEELEVVIVFVEVVVIEEKVKFDVVLE